METFPGERPTDPVRVFHELQPFEQAAKEKKRLAGQNVRLKVKSETVSR